MRRSLVLPAALLSILLAGSASAATVGLHDPVPEDPPAEPDVVISDYSLTDKEAESFTIQINSNGFAELLVRNATGVQWIDFHIVVEGVQDAVIRYVEHTALDRFSLTNADAMRVDVAISGDEVGWGTGEDLVLRLTSFTANARAVATPTIAGVIPLPAPAALLLSGLLGVGALRRRAWRG